MFLFPFWFSHSRSSTFSRVLVQRWRRRRTALKMRNEERVEKYARKKKEIPISIIPWTVLAWDCGAFLCWWTLSPIKAFAFVLNMRKTEMHWQTSVRSLVILLLLFLLAFSSYFASLTLCMLLFFFFFWLVCASIAHTVHCMQLHRHILILIKYFIRRDM